MSSLGGKHADRGLLWAPVLMSLGLTASGRLTHDVIFRHVMRRRAPSPMRLESAPSEVCRLQGHRHDVLLLQVSHDSSGIATGSKDGCVRVS